MRCAARITVAGALEDLPGEARIVVDCAPKPVASKNVDLYRQLGHKFMLQGARRRPFLCCRRTS